MRRRGKPEADGPLPNPPLEGAAAPVADAGEWSTDRPSDKELGLVQITLDRGVRTTAIGQLYGLDFDIEAKGFRVSVYFDQYNRRLKVIDYEAPDARALANRLAYLARENGYDKIVLMASKGDWQRFLELGFVLEGVLRYYFRGDDAYVMSRFGSAERATTSQLVRETEIIEALMRQSRAYTPAPLPEGYRIVEPKAAEVPAMVRLYRKVFRTYPSPLTHPDYVLQTMKRHVLYRLIVNPRGDVVSSASAEMNTRHKNAELTDCATRDRERGKGLMYHLLTCLEDALRSQGILNGYTLARATSVGMNRVFFRLGYEYTGRLVNNCDIAGRMEDMNIWVKPLGNPEGAG